MFEFNIFDRRKAVEVARMKGLFNGCSLKVGYVGIQISLVWLVYDVVKTKLGLPYHL